MSFWYISLSLLYSAFFMVACGKRESAGFSVPRIPAGSGAYLRAAFYLFFLLAAVRQAYLCAYAFQGIATADEHSYARIYAHAIGANEKIYGGFTQGVTAAALNLWFWIAGPSITAARGFSALLGLSGTLLCVSLIKKELGANLGFLTGILLCLSSYFMVFSATAVEINAVFFFIPLCLLLLRGHWGFTGSRLLGGALLAISFFTYPGLAFFWAGLALSTLALAPRAVIEASRRRNACAVIVAFAATFVALIALHFHFLAPPEMYSVRAGFLQGGGAWTRDFWRLTDSVITNASDLIIGGSSWYTSQLAHATFLEQALWGAFIVGAYTAWKSRSPRLRICLATLGIVFFGNLLIAQNPGMRRAAALLPLAYLFCAFGIDFFLQKAGTRLRGCGLAFALALLAWNAFLLAPRALSTASPFLTFPEAAVPEHSLLSTLEMGHVYLDPAEFHRDLDRLAAVSMRSLEHRFGHRKNLGEVRLEAPASNNSNERCAFLLTWKTPVMGQNTEIIYSQGERKLFRVSLSQHHTGRPCAP